MASAWFVVAPAGESQGTFLDPTVPGNAKIVEVATTSAAYRAWVSNGAYQGWQVVMGPFATEAQAKAAEPPAGLAALSTLTVAAASTIAHQAVNSPATSPAAIQSEAGGSLGSLFHLNLSWASAGNFLWRAAKITIGGTLLVAGLLKLTSLDDKALGVVGKAARQLPGVAGQSARLLPGTAGKAARKAPARKAPAKKAPGGK